ncbi:MAG: AraC family transcriptional regulator, partial [Cyclobacteriaceae bacterium]
MPIYLLNTYLLICGLHGIIQSLILFRMGRGESKYNQFLAIYIFSFSAVLIESSLKLMNNQIQLPNFIGVPFLFSGFNLFLYTKCYVQRGVSKKELLIHAAPMLLAFTLFGVNFFSEQINSFPRIFSANPVTNNIILNLIGGLHFVFYLGLTVIILRDFRVAKSEVKSKISWLYFLTSTSLVICIGVLTLVLFSAFMRENFDVRWAYLVWTIMSILIYGIGYVALQKPEVFRPMDKVLSGISQSITKYRNTRVSDDLVLSTIRHLEILLKEEHLYKVPDINLKKLAVHLNVSPNVLSRIINEHYGLNYNQLLNDYRLEEVKRKISDPAFDKYTILGIAMEAGFNSKSNFNDFFKRKLDQSPIDFKRNSRK